MKTVTEEIPESRVRGRILAYTAPPPDFDEKAPLHIHSALIVRETQIWIRKSILEAARLL